MRASRPTTGDLGGLAFEHGAVPSAVVQLEDGRARIKLANARFAALAGDDCADRWLDDLVVGEVPLQIAATTGDAISATVGECAVEVPRDGAAR